ncbi:MAG: uracil-DNA glycosylase, partial [Chloroflexota bacterium]
QALSCQRRDLWRTRTQVVFGEGPLDPALMLVGEGPGDTEDRQGRPFVGRAGALLMRVLASVGLERGDVYLANLVRSRPVAVTNGVKHNRAPQAGEVAACRVWMDAQLNLVLPRVVVCLGAVPASYLIHKNFRINAERGQVFAVDGTRRLATFHPAYLLRLQGADYQRNLEFMAADLKMALAAANRAGTMVLYRRPTA